jgi:hypothetical protein
VVICIPGARILAVCELSNQRHLHQQVAAELVCMRVMACDAPVRACMPPACTAAVFAYVNGLCLGGAA